MVNRKPKLKPLAVRVREAMRKSRRAANMRVTESRKKLDPAKVSAEASRLLRIQAAAKHGIPDFLKRLYQEPDEPRPVTRAPSGPLTSEKLLSELKQV
jgi:hypothetical protein